MFTSWKKNNSGTKPKDPNIRILPSRQLLVILPLNLGASFGIKHWISQLKKNFVTSLINGNHSLFKQTIALILAAEVLEALANMAFTYWANKAILQHATNLNQQIDKVYLADPKCDAQRNFRHTEDIKLGLMHGKHLKEHGNNLAININLGLYKSVSGFFNLGFCIYDLTTTISTFSKLPKPAISISLLVLIPLAIYLGTILINSPEVKNADNIANDKLNLRKDLQGIFYPQTASNASNYAVPITDEIKKQLVLLASSHISRRLAKEITYKNYRELYGNISWGVFLGSIYASIDTTNPQALYNYRISTLSIDSALKNLISAVKDILIGLNHIMRALQDLNTIPIIYKKYNDQKPMEETLEKIELPAKKSPTDNITLEKIRDSLIDSDSKEALSLTKLWYIKAFFRACVLKNNTSQRLIFKTRADQYKYEVWNDVLFADGSRYIVGLLVSYAALAALKVYCIRELKNLTSVYLGHGQTQSFLLFASFVIISEIGEAISNQIILAQNKAKILALSTRIQSKMLNFYFEDCRTRGEFIDELEPSGNSGMPSSDETVIDEDEGTEQLISANSSEASHLSENNSAIDIHKNYILYSGSDIASKYITGFASTTSSLCSVVPSIWLLTIKIDAVSTYKHSIIALGIVIYAFAPMIINSLFNSQIKHHKQELDNIDDRIYRHIEDAVIEKKKLAIESKICLDTTRQKTCKAEQWHDTVLPAFRDMCFAIQTSVEQFSVNWVINFSSSTTREAFMNGYNGILGLVKNKNSAFKNIDPFSWGRISTTLDEASNFYNQL
jgi:hypothetical protein